MLSGSPGTTFLPNYNGGTNRFSAIPSGTLSYDANGNLLADGFHTYGWDADGNLITVDGNTGVFDALDRRVELAASFGNDQMVYPPFDPTFQMSLASSLSALNLRIPLPGGGQAIYNSSGLAQYRHPNWQGSQLVLSWPTTSTPTWGSAFTPFGEKYAVYSSGFNGFFADMLGIADEGSISDAYQSTTRLYHQAQGRWVSPDKAGLAAVDVTNPQTWNRYAYVANNPLSFMDPDGTGPNDPVEVCYSMGSFYTDPGGTPGWKLDYNCYQVAGPVLLPGSGPQPGTRGGASAPNNGIIQKLQNFQNACGNKYQGAIVVSDTLGYVGLAGSALNGVASLTNSFSGTLTSNATQLAGQIGESSGMSAAEVLATGAGGGAVSIAQDVSLAGRIPRCSVKSKGPVSRPWHLNPRHSPPRRQPPSRRTPAPQLRSLIRA